MDMLYDHQRDAAISTGHHPSPGLLGDMRVVLATIATETVRHAPPGLPVHEAATLLGRLPANEDDGFDALAMRDVDAFCARLAQTPIRHPGDVFREEFFPSLGVTARSCAHNLGLTPAMLSLFMNGKRGISAVTAVKLAKLCGTSPAFWLRHQALHELISTAQDLADQLRRVPPLAGPPDQPQRPSRPTRTCSPGATAGAA